MEQRSEKLNSNGTKCQGTAGYLLGPVPRVAHSKSGALELAKKLPYATTSEAL